ncbi:SMI1/KNR4 family protein [Microtetraspora malaysiensis]|uniref:Knr4/Smi1-like domain-containing protein n=1 Tax=Microtetraspora malaysiensis TaxID=161358 RepID=A0ABW6T0L6_9ACTN
MPSAVAQITELISRRATPQSRNWEAVENELGTPLPNDYKQLADIYGAGVFDETFWLLEPGCHHNRDLDLAFVIKECDEVLAYLWKLEPKPTELDDDGARVLPWAFCEGSGHFLYWLVRPGQAPDDWTVMLNEGRGPEWESHSLSCSQFLFAAMTGDIDSVYFTGPLATPHQFQPITDFI